MNCAAQAERERSHAAEPQSTTLREEHALLLREVEARAGAVLAAADQGRWPRAELHELLNYLHLEVLRQVAEEEWLLFRAVRNAPEQLAVLRAEHLELRIAIELLDQAAATGGRTGGLSPSQLAASTRDLLTQLVAHFSSEDTLAIGTQAAPATVTFGMQPHEWYARIEGADIDLDELPGHQGTDAALDRLLRLRSDEQVQLRATCDLSPLCRRLTGTDPGGYGIRYLERGPNQWRVEITRRTAGPG